MFARLNHSRLLRYAGLFTWAVIGMPLLLLSLMPVDQAALGDDGVVSAHIDWQAWVAYAAFGISCGWLTRGLGTRRVGAFDYVLLMVLTGSAIGIIPAFEYHCLPTPSFPRGSTTPARLNRPRM